MKKKIFRRIVPALVLGLVFATAAPVEKALAEEEWNVVAVESEGGFLGSCVVKEKADGSRQRTYVEPVYSNMKAGQTVIKGMNVNNRKIIGLAYGNRSVAVFDKVYNLVKFVRKEMDGSETLLYTDAIPVEKGKPFKQTDYGILDLYKDGNCIIVENETEYQPFDDVVKVVLIDTRYCKVSFTVEPGMIVPAPVAVMKGSTAELPDLPNKADAVFLGWATEAGEDVTNETIFNEDTVLKPRWGEPPVINVAGYVERLRIDDEFYPTSGTKCMPGQRVIIYANSSVRPWYDENGQLIQNKSSVLCVTVPEKATGTGSLIVNANPGPTYSVTDLTGWCKNAKLGTG